MIVIRWRMMLMVWEFGGEVMVNRKRNERYRSDLEANLVLGF